MATELNIDTFGEIIDKFLMENHVQMLIDMPEGTLDVEVKDNVQLGPTVQFYILLQALPEVFKQFRETLGGNAFNDEKFVDSLFEMLKKEILKSEDNG